jgi:hypothetical protein
MVFSRKLQKMNDLTFVYIVDPTVDSVTSRRAVKARPFRFPFTIIQIILYKFLLYALSRGRRSLHDKRPRKDPSDSPPNLKRMGLYLIDPRVTGKLCLELLPIRSLPNKTRKPLYPFPKRNRLGKVLSNKSQFSTFSQKLCLRACTDSRRRSSLCIARLLHLRARCVKWRI